MKKLSTKEYMKKWREEHPNWKKEWYAKHPLENGECQKRWREKQGEKWAKKHREEINWLYHNRRGEKEKSRCRDELKRAKLSGRVSVKPCQVCGLLVSEAHHPNYSKPLEVIWLCPKHHKFLHYSLKKDKSL